MSQTDDEKPSQELLDEFAKHGFPMVDPDIDEKGWKQLMKTKDGPRVRQMIARLQEKAEEDRRRRKES